MPCKSVSELVDEYGPDWENFVTINSGPFSKANECNCCGQEGGCTDRYCVHDVIISEAFSPRVPDSQGGGSINPTSCVQIGGIETDRMYQDDILYIYCKLVYDNAVLCPDGYDGGPGFGQEGYNNACCTASSKYYGDGTYRWNTIQFDSTGTCCYSNNPPGSLGELGVCAPTDDCCNNPKNYATQVNWSRWRLKYNGETIGPDMSTDNARATSNIPVSCATRWDDPETPAYIVEVQSFSKPICSFGVVTFYTLSTVQLYAAVVNANGDPIAPLLRYCNYNFYITADESLTPTAHLVGPGLLVTCPNEDTNAYGADFSGCCSEVPGGPTCSAPTITFEPV